MDLKPLIDDYLKETKIMQLSTAVDNRPWICTVNFVFDDKWNLYWMSLRSSRHSKELAVNPHTAVAIVKDADNKQCMHITGTAQEVTSADILTVNALYANRYGEKQNRLEEAQSGDPALRTFYVFKPESIVIFDLLNFPHDPRKEYKL